MCAKIRPWSIYELFVGFASIHKQPNAGDTSIHPRCCCPCLYIKAAQPLFPTYLTQTFPPPHTISHHRDRMAIRPIDIERPFRRMRSWMDDPWSDLHTPNRMFDQFFGQTLRDSDFRGPPILFRGHYMRPRKIDQLLEKTELQEVGTISISNYKKVFCFNQFL